MVVTRTGLRFKGRKFPCSVGRSGIVAAQRKHFATTHMHIHPPEGLYGTVVLGQRSRFQSKGPDHGVQGHFLRYCATLVLSTNSLDI